jgi:hypothetical protein
MKRPPPYGFYPSSRRCPSCKARLVTTTPVNRFYLQGLLQELGLACYCVRCNTRYRATGRLRFHWVSGLGAFGRWIWWKTATLEVTLSPDPEFPQETGAFEGV